MKSTSIAREEMLLVEVVQHELVDLAVVLKLAQARLPDGWTPLCRLADPPRLRADGSVLYKIYAVRKARSRRTPDPGVQWVDCSMCGTAGPPGYIIAPDGLGVVCKTCGGSGRVMTEKVRAAP